MHALRGNKQFCLVSVNRAGEAVDVEERSYYLIIIIITIHSRIFPSLSFFSYKKIQEFSNSKIKIIINTKEELFCRYY